MANADYQEALQWLRAAEVAGARPATLSGFTNEFGERLQQAGRPVGKEGRAVASQLFARLYELANRFGAREDADGILLMGARAGCVSAAGQVSLVEALLRSGSVPPELRHFVSRYLRSDQPRADLVLRARHSLERGLSCAPNAPTAHAREVLRQAIPLQPDVTAAANLSAGIAAAYCALDRGHLSGTWMYRAEEGGCWPRAHAALLTYPLFARGETREVSALWKSWPSDRSALGPAEPGARLRCGLSLALSGDSASARSILEGLESRFGWIARNARALMELLDPSVKEPAAMVLERLPVPWLVTYWGCAAELAAGPAAQNPAAAPRLREFLTVAATRGVIARRWAAELLHWLLHRKLVAGEWKQADALRSLGTELGYSPLPEWQAAAVGALAGDRPPETPEIQAWLWRGSEPDPARVAQAAVVAAITGSESALGLLTRLSELLPPGKGSQDLLQAMAQELVDRTPAPTVLRWLSRPRLAAPLLSVLQRAAHRRVCEVLLATDPYEMADALAAAPVESDRCFQMLAMVFRGDLDGLSTWMETDAAPDRREATWRYLSRVLLAATAEAAAEKISESPKPARLVSMPLAESRERLADALGLRSADEVSPALAELSQAAAQGLPGFFRGWRRVMGNSKAARRQEAWKLLIGEPPPERSGTRRLEWLIEQVGIHWDAPARTLPLSFSEGDLTAWSTANEPAPGGSGGRGRDGGY